MQSLIFLVPLIVIYFVFMVPQQRRARELKATIASLKEGDEVLLTSGVYGFVAALDERVIWLEVAEGLELKVSRSSVASKVAESSAAESEEEPEDIEEFEETE